MSRTARIKSKTNIYHIMLICKYIFLILMAILSIHSFWVLYHFRYFQKNGISIEIDCNQISKVLIQDIEHKEVNDYYLYDVNKIRMLVEELNSLYLIELKPDEEKNKEDYSKLKTQVILYDKYDEVYGNYYIGEKYFIVLDKEVSEYWVEEYIILNNYYINSPPNIILKYYQIADDVIE